MKKSLVFALIAVFALSIFAVGCKKEEAAPETTTEAAPAAVETPAVDTAASTDTAMTTDTAATTETAAAPATTDTTATAAAPATK